jgi:hypothetical protein
MTTSQQSLTSRASFTSFPWQNGSVLHVGNLASMVESWLEESGTELTPAGADLMIVSVITVSHVTDD